MEKTRKNLKTILIMALCIFAILPMLIFATGCFVRDALFDTGLGLRITLNSNFEVDSDYRFDYCAMSNDALFVVDRQSRVDIEESGYVFDAMSEKDFLQSIINGNNSTATIQTKDELYYYEYRSTSGGYTFQYLSFGLKGQNCFYQCQFGCLREDYTSLKDTFFKWIKTADYDRGETIEIEEQQFSYMGMTITLNNAFKEVLTEDYIYGLSSNQDVAFLGFKIEFSELDEVDIESTTAADFANVYIVANSYNANVTVEGDRAYFVYTERGEDNTLMKYSSCVLKGEDAFYLCEFGCLQSQFTNFSQSFDAWLATITLATAE